MQRIKTICMKVGTWNGVWYSKKTLTNAVKNSKLPIPTTVDFDDNVVVGKCINLEMKNNNVIATIILEGNVEQFRGRSFAPKILLEEFSEIAGLSAVAYPAKNGVKCCAEKIR